MGFSKENYLFSVFSQWCPQNQSVLISVLSEISGNDKTEDRLQIRQMRNIVECLAKGMQITNYHLGLSWWRCFQPNFLACEKGLPLTTEYLQKHEEGEERGRGGMERHISYPDRTLISYPYPTACNCNWNSLAATKVRRFEILISFALF